MKINFIYLLVKRISTSSWLLLRKLDLFPEPSYCHSRRIHLVRLEALHEKGANKKKKSIFEVDEYSICKINNTHDWGGGAKGKGLL